MHVIVTAVDHTVRLIAGLQRQGEGLLTGPANHSCRGLSAALVVGGSDGGAGDARWRPFLVVVSHLLCGCAQ